MVVVSEVEIFRDGIDRALEEARLHVAQDDVVTGASKNMGDTVVHRASAKDRHGNPLIMRPPWESTCEPKDGR